MDRLSSRFSIGNRLARLSTNWGLPDALARLGLADPSAPLHPGPHLGPPHSSLIAEEGSVGQKTGQAAAGCLQAGREQQQQKQQQQQPLFSHAREPIQSASGGKRLQRRSTQQHKESAASNAAMLFSEPVLSQQGASDVSGNGNGDVATAGQTAADDGDGDGDEDEGAAKQTAAENTGLKMPASSSSPVGRAALALLGNVQSSPLQSELPLLAVATICTQPDIYIVDHYRSSSMRQACFLMPDMRSPGIVMWDTLHLCAACTCVSLTSEMSSADVLVCSLCCLAMCAVFNMGPRNGSSRQYMYTFAPYICPKLQLLPRMCQCKELLLCHTFAGVAKHYPHSKLAEQLTNQTIHMTQCNNLCVAASMLLCESLYMTM